MRTRASTATPFAQLESQKLAALAAADTELAITNARLAKEATAAQREHRSKHTAATAAFDTGLADNETLVMDRALRDLTGCVFAFREQPSRDTARAVMAAVRECNALALEKTGRALDPRTLGFAMAQTILKRDASAVLAFGNPVSWHCTAVGAGDAVDRVLRAVANNDVGAASAALEDLETRCLRIAREQRGKYSQQQAQAHWEVMISGRSPAMQEAMHAELEGSAQQALTAEWEEKRNLTRRARAGDAGALASLDAATRAGLRYLNSKIFGELGPSVEARSSDAFAPRAP